jgi:DNA-binding response OmpR family regulator
MADAPHLLVVDDDPGVREALSAALSEEYVVHVAAGPADALDLLRAQPVAAILLDVMLGEDDGIRLIERLRGRSGAPILILTGHSSENVAIRALWAKAEGYLKKPVEMGLLRRTVAELIESTAPADGLERARRHLVNHLGQPHTTPSLAEIAGMSDRHLRRAFRDRFGATPRQYLLRARLRQAAERLANTTQGIEQVAIAVGFPSVALFDRCFRRVHGMTPSAFRARARRPPAPPTTPSKG